MLNFPIYRSLLFPQLIFGVNKNVAIMIFTFTFVMVFQLQIYSFIVLPIPVFFILSKVTKKDPFMADILLQKIKLKEVFD